VKKTLIVVAIALVVAIAMAACAGKRAAPPIPLPDSEIPLHGKFVWYDLLTEDLAAAKTFYGELLGWKFTDTSYPDYTLIEHGGRPIGGIVDMAKVHPDHNQSQWVSLLSVADVDEAVRVTRSAGGEVHVEPKDIGDLGRLAVVSDPQGAVVSFLRVASGDQPDEKAEYGDWMWTELWTGDVDASSEFYSKLVGYDLDKKTILDDIEYVIFTRDDDPRAGVIPRPVEEVRAHWLPYVRVEDPAALAAKVEGLGGFVLLAPKESIRKGTVTIVLDPTGAALALQQWEEGA